MCDYCLPAADAQISRATFGENRYYTKKKIGICAYMMDREYTNRRNLSKTRGKSSRAPAYQPKVSLTSSGALSLTFPEVCVMYFFFLLTNHKKLLPKLTRV